MSALSERMALCLSRVNKRKSDLVRYVGISYPTVNAWFTGDTKKLDGVNLVKAAEFFGVNPLWLAQGTGPMAEGDVAPKTIVEEFIDKLRRADAAGCVDTYLIDSFDALLNVSMQRSANEQATPGRSTPVRKP